MPLNSWLRQRLSKELQIDAKKVKKTRESLGDDLAEVMGETYARETGSLTDADKKKLQPKKKSMLSFLKGGK